MFLLVRLLLKSNTFFEVRFILINYHQIVASYLTVTTLIKKFTGKIVFSFKIVGTRTC